MAITFTPVNVNANRVSYSDIEADLNEARNFSLEAPKSQYLSVDVKNKAKFNGQLRTYAADHGLKVSRKRSDDNTVIFRFVTPSVAE